MVSNDYRPNTGGQLWQPGMQWNTQMGQGGGQMAGGANPFMQPAPAGQLNPGNAKNDWTQTGSGGAGLAMGSPLEKLAGLLAQFTGAPAAAPNNANTLAPAPPAPTIQSIPSQPAPINTIAPYLPMLNPFYMGMYGGDWMNTLRPVAGGNAPGMGPVLRQQSPGWKPITRG